MELTLCFRVVYMDEIGDVQIRNYRLHRRTERKHAWTVRTMDDKARAAVLKKLDQDLHLEAGSLLSLTLAHEHYAKEPYVGHCLSHEEVWEEEEEEEQDAKKAK